MDWIPIDANTPRDGTFILLAWYTTSLYWRVERGAWHVGVQKFHVPSEGFDFTPTHWAECPQPPV